MQLVVVEGDTTSEVIVDLFDNNNTAVTPATSCVLDVLTPTGISSTNGTLLGANRVSFNLSSAMVATPGIYRARFYVDSTTYYPSDRNPFTILVRPHTRSR